MRYQRILAISCLAAALMFGGIGAATGLDRSGPSVATRDHAGLGSDASAQAGLAALPLETTGSNGNMNGNVNGNTNGNANGNMNGNANGGSGLPGDADGDGDVDLDDYSVFAACLSGPFGGVAPGCAFADFNGDAAVDLRDYAEFQIAFTGPGGGNGNMNGNVNGNANGNVNGNANGNMNGNANGNMNGNANGNVNGNANGNVNGNANGNVNGNANGNVNGNANGNMNGNANGNVNGNANGNVNGNANGNGGGGVCPDGSVRLSAGLSGSGPESGFATYRLDTDGRERFRVDVSSFSPGSYTVRISGVDVGQIVVGSGGDGRLEYDSDNAPLPPGFPAVGVGDTVSVGGRISGTFVLDCS